MIEAYQHLIYDVGITGLLFEVWHNDINWIIDVWEGVYEPDAYGCWKMTHSYAISLKDAGDPLEAICNLISWDNFKDRFDFYLEKEVK